MLHHIKQTADGFATLIGGLGFFAVSANVADWTMKIISFVLGCVVSVFAIIYYYQAIRKDASKK